MNQLIQYDIALFSKINGQWHTPFLDWLFPFLRNQFFWSPLYLFVVVFMLVNFGKDGLRWIMFFLITFAIADFASSSVIKPLVGRLRPCNNPMLAETIRSLVSCGSGKSFTSSHATNHFALGFFAFSTISFVKTAWKWLFLVWALVISYAQVYVGVHFPLDITFGALLGCTVASGTAWAFNKRNPFPVLA